MLSIEYVTESVLVDLQRTTRAEENRQTRKMVRFNGFAEPWMCALVIKGIEERSEEEEKEWAGERVRENKTEGKDSPGEETKNEEHRASSRRISGRWPPADCAVSKNEPTVHRYLMTPQTISKLQNCR